MSFMFVGGFVFCLFCLVWLLEWAFVLLFVNDCVCVGCGFCGYVGDLIDVIVELLIV